MKRPFMLWPLIFCLFFLSLGGFSGGIPMLADPANGGYLQFGDLLPLLPVHPTGLISTRYHGISATLPLLCFDSPTKMASD